MIEDVQLETLINLVYEYYGFDFGNYSRASLKRRVNRVYTIDGFSCFSDFMSKIRSEPIYFKRFVEEITVNVTEMFRDPSFYKVIRNEIIPNLAAKPFIRIWHAGCATGEEVYSIAIILKEANLLDKSLIYATDINTAVLEKARKGVFMLPLIKQYAENYRNSGGEGDFSNYYSANYGLAKFNEELSRKMVFSQHNLVSDTSFNEFDLILCRNVLIYFDKDLQRRALSLFDDSLASLGYLALGTKETLKFNLTTTKFVQCNNEKIWRKVG
jgi:chemotaxis protein methyltransferase CheR